MNTRLEIASRIAAGFAANPAIFAPNARCGWRLVNASEAALAKYALELADTLIAASDGARFYWSQGGAVTKDGPITHAIPALDHDPDATAWVAICGAVCSGPPARHSFGNVCPQCLLKGMKVAQAKIPPL